MFSPSSNRTRSPRREPRPLRGSRVAMFACTFAVVGSFSLLAGCGSGDSTAAKPGSSQNSASIMDAKIRGEKEQIRKTLVGVWLGGAFLDEAILVEKLKDLSPEAGEEVMRKAQYFATTMMAIDFKADGTLENEIEIVPPGGQPQSEQGFGTWKITQVGDDGFVVEIVEQHADGAVTKSRKVYQFYDDENHFAVSIPLEDVLGACNPLIVFERQKILPEGSQLAEAPRGSAPR